MDTKNSRDAFIQRRIEQYYRGDITFRYVLDTLVLILNISITTALIMSLFKFSITGDGTRTTLGFIKSSIELLLIFTHSNFLQICCKDVHYREGKVVIKYKRKMWAMLWFSGFIAVELLVYKCLGLDLLNINTPYLIIPCIALSYFNDPLIPLKDYQTRDKKDKDNIDNNGDNESGTHLDKLV